MTPRTRRVLFYVTGTMLGLFWAVLLDVILCVGRPRYLSCSGVKLCSQVTPGMELDTVKARISALGEPLSVEYHKRGLSVGAGDGTCAIALDANGRVTSSQLFAPDLSAW